MKMEEREIYKPAHPKAPKYHRVILDTRVDTVDTKNTTPLITYIQKRLKKKYPQYKKTNKQATAIFRAFNENVVKAILENRAGVILPEKMGKLQVIMIKRNRKKKRINRYLSTKLGYVVYLDNERNGGKYPYLCLDVNSKSYSMKNKELWEFRPTQEFKAKIYNALTISRTRFADAGQEYLAYYRKNKFYKKEFYRKKEAELLLTYNEFEGI
jgi:hypothetical protein